MAIKLIKACKELNIGMATLTAWCERNGYAVESDPNFRLDDDLYLRLAKEFNQDLAIKLEADREAEERAAANDPAYAEALQAKRAAERAARIAAAKAAADKAREDAQKQQTGSNLSLQNFDWDAYVVQQQGTKYKEEIQKYNDTLSAIKGSEIIEGTVISINKREVVVNVGYKVDGIVSADEFRYNPNLRVGDKVEVYIVNDKDTKGRIIISHKEARIRRSWERVEAAYKAGEVVSGYIKWKVNGGMIVDVLGMDAFLPGSQIDVKPVRDFEALVGKTMDFKIIEITPEKRNAVISHRVLIDANYRLGVQPKGTTPAVKPANPPKQKSEDKRQVNPATANEIKKIWEYYIDIQKFLLEQKSLPISIKPETIDFKEAEGKFYVEVDDINETKIKNIIANDLGIEDFDCHSNCIQVDNILWQTMTQEDKEQIQNNLSLLSAELNIVPSIDVAIKYGQNVERIDQMTLDQIRQFDQEVQKGTTIQGHIDDVVAFISRLKFDLNYHIDYLFGDHAKQYRYTASNMRYRDLQYLNSYIPAPVLKEYSHDIGLTCTCYRLIFRINDPEAFAFLRDHYEVYDKQSENSVVYSRKDKAFVFERDITKKDRYSVILEKEIPNNIQTFFKGLGAYYTGSNVEVNCEFRYTFPCDMLEEYLCRQLYDHIAASDMEGISINSKTRTIGIDFDWRNESIQEKIDYVTSLMPGLSIDLQEQHRFKCRVQNSYVGYDELKLVLSNTFENIRISNDELTQTIHINLEYEYDYYDSLRKMLLLKLEILGYDKSQLSISENDEGKIRLSFMYNDEDRIKEIEEKLEELRLADFAFETRDGSIPFGRLLRVNYPTLFFDVTYPKENQKAAIDQILLNQSANTVVPILTGDREKLARLKKTYGKATSGEGLQNADLSKFMFDSSLATITPDIENFTNSDGSTYLDMKRNQLNAHINKSQMQAIIKAMNARDLAVIQGPPGTGKSTAISELIWQLIRRGVQQGQAPERILLTSETNLAVDNAIARTVNNKTNLVKPIRFGDDEKLASEGLQFSLKLMQDWAEFGDVALEGVESDEETDSQLEKSNLILKNWLDNISRRSFGGQDGAGIELAEKWRNLLAHPPQWLRQLVLKNYQMGCNVVGATCSSIGEERADNVGVTSFFRTYTKIFSNKADQAKVNFTTVIQDESSKATPAELIQPFVYGERAIVIGDHRQLPPMLDQEEIEESLTVALEKAQSQEETNNIKRLLDLVRNNFKELEISHFQRLYENIDTSLKGTFNMQYRMHPDINKVIEQFYVDDGGLKCGWTIPQDQGVNDPDFSNPASRYHGIEIDGLIDENTHVLFVNTETPEMLDGTSRVNYGEIEVVDKLLSRFEQSESYKQYLSHFTTDEEKQVGIISFYGKQVRQLQAVAKKHNAVVPARVSTVDRFQGMERNIIIVSMVRSDRIQSSRNQLPNQNKYPDTGGYPRQKSLGFAQSPNRLNVALSRARRLLIIVGNERLFTQKDIYRNLFQTIRQNQNNHIIEAYKL